MSWWRWLASISGRRDWSSRRVRVEVETGRYRILKPLGEPGPGEADDIRVPVEYEEDGKGERQ